MNVCEKKFAVTVAPMHTMQRRTATRRRECVAIESSIKSLYITRVELRDPLPTFGRERNVSFLHTILASGPGAIARKRAGTPASGGIRLNDGKTVSSASKARARQQLQCPREEQHQELERVA